MIEITTIGGKPAWVTLANIDAVIQRDGQDDRYTIILTSGNLIEVAKTDAASIAALGIG